MTRRIPVGKARRRARASLREVSDREIMEMLIECEDDDRLVDSRTLVDVFAIEHEKPLMCVGARLSWMKRWGYVVKVEKGVWSITRKGRNLVSVPVTDSSVKAMTALSEADYCAVVSAAARRHRLSPEASRLAKREWVHYHRNGG
jgi:hypothetical protein